MKGSKSMCRALFLLQLAVMLLGVQADEFDEVEIDYIRKNMRESTFMHGFDGFAGEVARYADACRDKAIAALNTAFNTDKPITDDHYLDISYAIAQFYLNELRPYSYNYYKSFDKGEPRHAPTKTASTEIFTKCKTLSDAVDRSVKALPAKKA